jgi:hypothetical protein
LADAFQHDPVWNAVFDETTLTQRSYAFETPVRYCLKYGFVHVAQALPSFSLLVQRFNDAPLPTFPNDWEVRQACFGSGLTVIRTPQCPYIEDATTIALELAAEKGFPFANLAEWPANIY